MAVRVVPVTRPARTFKEQIYLWEIWKGLSLTTGRFFLNLTRHALRAMGLRAQPGAVTIQYPDDPAMLAARARTNHRLLMRDDGTPRCTACMLCETICPAKCIRIVAEDSPDVMIEKRAKSFSIDLGMCVFCGYCVEACPVDAIHMDGNDVELSSYDRDGMIWGITDLLAVARQRQDPPRPPS